MVFSTYNFADQVMKAIEKIRNPPTVDSTIMKPIDDVDLPIVTICPTNQTNSELLDKFYGNKNPNAMLAGKALCNGKPCLSWGNHLNMSHKKLLHKVYNSKLAKDFKIENLRPKRQLSGSLVFLPRFGYCREIFNYSTSNIRIKNYNNVTDIRIFITDKTYRSYTSLDYSSHNGQGLEINNIDGVYRVNVKMKVVSSCQIVSPMELDYQECVNEILERDIGAYIGCLPPWMAEFNQCNSTYPDDLPKKIPNYLDYVHNPVHLKNTIGEIECKKACRTTNNFVSVRDIRYDETFLGSKGSRSGRVFIDFDEQVEVTEKIFNYSTYNFIIDVGSSLGLWFGLSVFGIYDLVIEIFKFVRIIFNKFKRLCKN